MSEPDEDAPATAEQEAAGDEAVPGDAETRRDAAEAEAAGDAPADSAEQPDDGDAPADSAEADDGVAAPSEEAGDDAADGPGPRKVQPELEGPGELAIVSALESLVFASEKPLSAIQLGKLAGATPSVVKRLLAYAATRYEGRGLELVEVAGGYQFRTAPENAEVVRRLLRQKPVRLTRAQLETLAIVAYRQPVTRPEVDEIRGVDTGSALKVLLERNLLKVLGRKDEPGRPLLYGTTPHFLEFFGLASLRDLPTLREFSELSEESRGLFERRMGEPLVEDEAPADGAADDGGGAAAAATDEPGEEDRSPGEPDGEDDATHASDEHADEDADEDDLDEGDDDADDDLDEDDDADAPDEDGDDADDDQDDEEERR